MRKSVPYLLIIAVIMNFSCAEKNVEESVEELPFVSIDDVEYIERETISPEVREHIRAEFSRIGWESIVQVAENGGRSFVPDERVRSFHINTGEKFRLSELEKTISVTMIKRTMSDRKPDLKTLVDLNTLEINTEIKPGKVIIRARYLLDTARPGRDEKIREKIEYDYKLGEIIGISNLVIEQTGKEMFCISCVMKPMYEHKIEGSLVHDAGMQIWVFYEGEKDCPCSTIHRAKPDDIPRIDVEKAAYSERNAWEQKPKFIFVIPDE